MAIINVRNIIIGISCVVIIWGFIANVPSCSSNPCLNGATCMESSSRSGYTCLCPALYTGIDCGTRVLSCSSSPCLNGATCMESSSGSGYTCFCPAPYTGRDCGTRDKENGLLPIVIVLIVITTFGLAWSINNTEKTGKIPPQKQAQSIDLEDTTTKPSQLQEECNIGDDFTTPPTMYRPGVYGVHRLGFRSQRQAQPRRRVQGPLLKRCGLDDDFTRQLHLETQIRQLRGKIINYRPGEWTLRDVGVNFTRPPKIRLGVFGITCSGKSTLLNSLHFSLTDTWKEIYAEGQNVGLGGETVFRGFMKLTDHVTTVDTRGIFDFSARRLSDVMAEISGNRGIDPNRRHRSDKIDCPIFVFKYSVDIGMMPCMEFLSILVDETKKRFGAYPIVVITFGDRVANKDQILYEIVQTGMPRSNVFFIENYTKDKHEMIKERHVALLKILEACIVRADDNITFRWTREQELTVCGKLKNAFSKI